MQGVIGEAVNKAQLGFIPGRHIGDHILLAIELIIGFFRAHMSLRCIMKVDIRKAYDSVEWSILEALLHEFEFPRIFMGWIMECVTTMSYAVLVNAYGLAASMEKSNIYFCGISDETDRELVDIVHMQIGDLPFRYLGVLLTSKKFSYAQNKPLVEKITNRAQTWMAHLLSYAGRLQLIKSILSSIQHYWAHIFPLSKKIIQAVERVCKRFLWTGSTEESRKSPVAWTILQLPKSGGGCNFINMLYWNKAAMLKLLWAIEFKRDKL
ncbi:uncharacterized protein LOC104896775 [Beta vulgaris subsp. vulgaris]|uniref:uncharacterized protein LOC104896775 n=1 Tax=Beta vulgaris subsp. vulgaris TaxID=3555 RepID=UPI0020373C2B|nr:uncharacterized protein LOC104896775 [Beta vulgaris subsp. vulgaris]